MPSQIYTFGNDGTISDFGLTNTVAAGANNIEWCLINDTGNSVRVSFNRTGSDITATMRVTSFHRDTVTLEAMDVSADEVFDIPVGGVLTGQVSNAGTGAEGFGLRSAVVQHLTGAIQGESLRLFVA